MVSVIDGETNTVTDTIPVGVDPHGIAVDSDSGLIYVTNAGRDEVYVIDGVTNTVIDTIDAINFPVGVAVDSDSGLIYVTDGGRSAGTLDVIKVSNVLESLTTLDGGELQDIPINNSPVMAVVAGNEQYTTGQLPEPLFCNGMTVDELITSGNYNVIDNRDGHLDGAPIVGTDNDDLILASNDGNHIKAGNGNDCLIGGTGDDKLKGNVNPDIIFDRIKSILKFRVI